VGADNDKLIAQLGVAAGNPAGNILPGDTPFAVRISPPWDILEKTTPLEQRIQLPERPLNSSAARNSMCGRTRSATIGLSNFVTGAGFADGSSALAPMPQAEISRSSEQIHLKNFRRPIEFIRCPDTNFSGNSNGNQLDAKARRRKVSQRKANCRLAAEETRPAGIFQNRHVSADYDRRTKSSGEARFRRLKVEF